MSEQKPHIAVIGGGAGGRSVCAGLSQHDVEISAIVNMSDDGGSTGILRREQGVMPPGDVRQAICALSRQPEDVIEMFNYRYPDHTPLGGHTYGNLVIAMAERAHSDFATGLAVVCEQMRVKGDVLPVTLENHDLVMSIGDMVVVGECAITELEIDPKQSRPELWLYPPAPLNPDVHDAISEADMVVIAPGDLYGSLAPALLTGGMTEALATTNADVVYISNLVNRPHYTEGFSPTDYADELQRLAGRRFIDTVVYQDQAIDPEHIARYAKPGESPLEPMGTCARIAYKTIGADLLAKHVRIAAFDGPVTRSYVRHDPEKLAQAILGVQQ